MSEGGRPNDGGLQRSSHPMLVSCRLCRLEGVVLQADASRKMSRDNGRIVVDRDNRIDRIFRVIGKHLASCLLGIKEAQREESIGIACGEGIFSLARGHYFDAEFKRRIEEGLRAIGGGRQK